MGDESPEKISEFDEFRDEIAEDDPSKPAETLAISGLRGKERRKAAKKLKRKQLRKEIAVKAREEEEARLNDPEEQRRIALEEREEAERIERERKEFEERERVWIERAAKKAEEDAERQRIEDESRQRDLRSENEDDLNDDDDWDYVEEGPAEIIWQGNEIIVKKKRVRIPKKSADLQSQDKDADRPTSNPLPPQSEAFSSYKSRSAASCQEILESVAQETPNFGTEQDKAHCPFHLKTGACRFGSRCSRVHFYPDKSCTLLIKNMYNGPGIAWEQDEGLEYTDEEIDRCYEEFYEDVHTEFLKFGEIVNFKITCEFVGVTRWKVAICGEYMKSRLKVFLTMSQLIEQTCSHGTACNFIHCFRNPGGDYEWADWDKPPPRHWVKKMVALFGDADESTYENCTGQDSNVRSRSSSRKTSWNQERYHSRRSKSRDIDNWDSSSGVDSSDENRNRSGRTSRRKHSRNARNEDDSRFENYRPEGRNVSRNCDYSDSPRKDKERLSSLSRTSTLHPKKGRASPNYDSYIVDENDYYIEHDRYGAKEGRKRDSARRHSKSSGQSSRREDSGRQAKKESVLDEHIATVDNCESKNRIGYDYRSDSHDMNAGLESRETINQLDRWETRSTISGENEKLGNLYMDGNESYIANYKSHEEQLGRQRPKTKTRSRIKSQSSQRTKSTARKKRQALLLVRMCVPRRVAKIEDHTTAESARQKQKLPVGLLPHRTLMENLMMTMTMMLDFTIQGNIAEGIHIKIVVAVEGKTIKRIMIKMKMTNLLI
ncbi:hypothetical protein Syun_002862 [Stephania yunnanensis]|uniref:C3H1-type domain-containing protein n=1 Tax=Stephania yunnanensis TaxID=152371 RepID=A0AAP0L151_9MAGN